MRRLLLYLFLILLGVGAIAGVVWWRNQSGPPPLDTGAFAVDGTSDQLKSTVIVPTLDTPPNRARTSSGVRHSLWRGSSWRRK